MSQANLETRIKYGPQASALSQLMADSDATYKQGVRNEGAAAEGLRQAAREGDSKLAQIYRDAGSGQGQASGDLKQDLSTLGPTADRFKAAAAKENAGAQSRLVAAGQGARAELVNRGVDAEAGRVFATRQLKAKHDDDLSKISKRREELAGEAGAYTIATLQDLKGAQAKAEQADREFALQVDKFNADNKNAAADRAIRREGQDIQQQGQAETRRHNRATETIARRKPSTRGPSRGAIASHEKLMGTLTDTVAAVERLRRTGMPYPGIGTVLTSPKSKENPFGATGPIAARAAVEIVRDRTLSQPTYRALRLRGMIPARTPRSWRPHPNTTKPKPFWWQK